MSLFIMHFNKKKQLRSHKYYQILVVGHKTAREMERCLFAWWDIRSCVKKFLIQRFTKLRRVCGILRAGR